MTVASEVVPGEVLGDGSSSRGRARDRWRAGRPWLVVGIVLLVGAAVAVLPAPPTSSTPGAPDNPSGTGARAAARILERQGVEVDHVVTTSDAVASARRGGTVLVVGDEWLMPEQVEALRGLENDLVLVDAGATLGILAPDLVDAGTGGTRSTRSAGCTDPDAAAAGTIAAAGGYRDLGGSATVCFPDAAGAGAYVVTEQDGRRVTALSDLWPLTNDALADEGDAALVLRMLGREDRLVWFVPRLDDFTTGGDTDAGTSIVDLVPWVRPVAGWLAVVLLVAVVWRARRLGPVVAEPLPVVVRSAEATRGRGRLYRRARARGHAAAALRAGTAARVAHRLGLPRSAGAPELVDALARASDRPARDIEILLYGPPPRDDASLVRLAHDLDRLESEVHRP